MAIQSPLLEFESSAFPVTPGEDEETNPGIYGRALAQWLAEQLRAAGFDAGAVISEDFGWCVPVAATTHSLYVVCASLEAAPNRWRVFRRPRKHTEEHPADQERGDRDTAEHRRV